MVFQRSRTEACGFTVIHFWLTRKPGSFVSSARYVQWKIAVWSSGFRRKVATAPIFLVAKPRVPVAKCDHASPGFCILCDLSFIQNLSASSRSLLLLVQHCLAKHFFSASKTTPTIQAFHRHSRWLYIQQQSSLSSSNRFIEHDVSTRKLDCWKTKNSVVVKLKLALEDSNGYFWWKVREVGKKKVEM